MARFVAHDNVGVIMNLKVAHEQNEGTFANKNTSDTLGVNRWDLYIKSIAKGKN